MNHKLMLRFAQVATFVLLFSLFNPKLNAQVNSNEIVGLFNDPLGNPIINASVIAKNGSTGFTAGTTTDSTGKFYFKNLPLGGPYSFEIEAVNYETQILKGYTIKNGDKISLYVTSKQVIANLNEVVVVGYNDKKRNELTSSVVTVSDDKLKDVTTNDLGNMLQGKVSGLQVVSSSGAPGANAEIRLRGVSSVNASQDPLYVVDGIIGGNFDPNDIETVSVLKDAGATAMYGSQANGGVIVITTKKAKTNKARFEVKLTSGIRKADFGNMQLMNSSQLYNYSKQFYRDYTPGDPTSSYKIDLLAFYANRPLSLRTQNYNWLNTMFKPAPINSYYISASGKTEKVDYYLGLSYYKEAGTFTNTDYNRINVRLNSTYRFNKKINVVNNINISANKGRSYNYMDVYYSYLNMPWDNPYDNSGMPRYVDATTVSSSKWWSRDPINPVHTVAHSNYPFSAVNANYDMVFNWSILDWLSFSSSNRLSASVNKNSTFIDPVAAGVYHGTGYLNEQAAYNYGGISTNLLKFKFSIGNRSRISGLAGFEGQSNFIETMGAAGKGMPIGLNVLDVVSNSQAVNGYNTKVFIQSLISQVTYSYDNRYFLTGSLRNDGSSNFPANKRYGTFPALSAAWLISNEGFMSKLKAIDLLKLRGSWGITGSQSINPNSYLGLFALTTNYNNLPGATLLQLASPNLTWEAKHQNNLGLDLRLWKRVDFSVDVYNNITKNLLLYVPQPSSTGVTNTLQNAGKVINKGIELGLNTINITNKNFEWETDFNISFNKNTLQDLPTQLVLASSGSPAIQQIYRNGGNLFEFYMPKWLGVDPQTGAPLWEQLTKDANGNITGKQSTSNYASATYQEGGNALPVYQGSITNKFRYTQFTLSANLYFVKGNKVYSNNLEYVMNDGGDPLMNQIVLPSGYTIWTHPGDIATNPSPQNNANSTSPSTRFLKDGSYLALRNVTLAYEIPQQLVKKLKLDALSIALTADNVYTFTHFLGQDPRTTINPQNPTDNMAGISDFKYPNNRQYMLSINCRF